MLSAKLIELCGKQFVTNDLICVVCQSLFVEPVVLPCKHGFCLNCFNGILKFNTLTCPCCRKRFGQWLRQANKDKTLVDQKLWEFIQKNEKELSSVNEKHRNSNNNNTDSSPGRRNGSFSDKRIKGRIGLSSTGTRPNVTISKPGEIRKEYEIQLEKYRKELELERQNELKATSSYILKLYKEEESSNASDSEINAIKTMLVANPGHTPYSLSATATAIASTSNSKTICSSTKTNLNIKSTSATATVTASSSSSSLAVITGSSNGNATYGGISGGGSLSTIANASSSSSLSSITKRVPIKSSHSLTAPSSPASLLKFNPLLKSNPITEDKFGLLKSFTVRLNRGTELIKQTVHKALQSKINPIVNSTLLTSQFYAKNYTTEKEKLLLTVPPTNTHRTPSRNSSNSVDSLKLEMCHFKPIRTVPTTPVRRLESGILKTPKVKRITKTHPLLTPKLSLKVDLASTLHQRQSAFSRTHAVFKRDSTSSSKEILSRLDKEFEPNSYNELLRNQSPVSIKTFRLRGKTTKLSSTAVSTPITINTEPRPKLGKNVSSEPSKGRSRLKLNGLASNTLGAENGRYNTRHQNNRRRIAIKGNTPVTAATNPTKSSVDSIRHETEICNKIIIEQKKCEILIRQEMSDYEFAKKLQAELDVEIKGRTVTSATARTNVPRTRRQTKLHQESEAQENVVTTRSKRKTINYTAEDEPEKKNLRTTRQTSKAPKPSSQPKTKKSTRASLAQSPMQVSSLRRSKRQIAMNS